jgi:hypothetical protein
VSMLTVTMCLQNRLRSASHEFCNAEDHRIHRYGKIQAYSRIPQSFIHPCKPYHERQLPSC